MSPINFSVLICYRETDFKLTANTISKSPQNNHEKIHKRIGTDFCFVSVILMKYFVFLFLKLIRLPGSYSLVFLLRDSPLIYILALMNNPGKDGFPQTFDFIGLNLF